MGDKMSAASKSRLEAEIKKVEDAIATNNTSAIKSLKCFYKIIGFHLLVSRLISKNVRNV